MTLSSTPTFQQKLMVILPILTLTAVVAGFRTLSDLLGSQELRVFPPSTPQPT